MRRSVVDTLGVEAAVNAHALKGLFFGVFLLVGACGGGSKPAPGKPCALSSGCTDAGAGDGGGNTVIGTAGGTVSAAGASVAVPAGALAQDEAVSIAVATSGYPAIPAGAVLLSNVLAFEPHGQPFTKPVTVSVGFTARQGATPQLITAAPGGSWASVDGATISAASMQAMVSHFSFFAVMGLTPDGGADDVPVDSSGDAAAGDSGPDGAAGVPVVLATGFDQAGSIASDGTSIFFGGNNWHENGGLVRESRLVQVPIAGGPMTTRFAWSGANVVGTNEFGGGITVDGTNLFFCAGGHAFSMPIATGTAVDLMPPTSSHPDYGCWLPVVDATNLYSGSDSNFAEVFSIPKTGGTPNLFAGNFASSPSTYASRSMASDGTYVYWVPGGTSRNTMVRALGAGGPPETIVSPAATDAGAFQYLGFLTSNLVITGGYIYWIESGTGFLPYCLWRVPLAGGTPVLVTSGSAIFAGPVSDGTSLYWFEGINGVYSIKKTSVTPGSPVTTVVADAVGIPGDAIPQRFTVDDTNVYWLYPPNLYKAPK